MAPFMLLLTQWCSCNTTSKLVLHRKSCWYLAQTLVTPKPVNGWTKGKVEWFTIQDQLRKTTQATCALTQGIHNDLSWAGHHRWERSMIWWVLCKNWSYYLTSLVPICCRISCRSSSDVRCKMFLSSSSFFDGLLPSLIARVSLRRILLAKAPEDWKRQKCRKKGL